MATKTAKSDVTPTSKDAMALVPKLGGMPPKLDADQVAAKNSPGSRSPAPNSFRPGSK